MSASFIAVPENLIGTKWIAAGDYLKNKDTIEFVDMMYCLYTSIDSLELFFYQFRGNRVIIGEILAYVILDDTLFFNGYPAFFLDE